MPGRSISDGDHGERDDPPRYVRIGNALLAIAEDAIYVGIATLLAISAGVLLLSAARGLTQVGELGASEAVLEVLDRLLLVFIVVELLFAVRVILGKREVVAEPFLIVGIIASIKEIIVLSVKAADYVGKGEKFNDAIVEVAVLGGLVLVLAVSAILLRLKETRTPGGRRGSGPRVQQGRRGAQGRPG